MGRHLYLILFHFYVFIVVVASILIAAFGRVVSTLDDDTDAAVTTVSLPSRRHHEEESNNNEDAGYLLHHNQDQQQKQQQERSRNLLFDEQCGDCNPQLWATVSAVDSTAHTCLECDAEWDEAGTISVKYVSVTGTFYNSYLDMTFPNMYTWYDAAYIGGGTCAMFDSCLYLDGSEIVDHNQYQYDCTNIYCGPNARRDCDGKDYDVPCADDSGQQQQQQPIIPSLNQVTCERLRIAVNHETCGLCAEGEDDDGVYHYNCGLCTRCSQSGQCLSGVGTYSHTEVLTQIQECTTESFEDNTWCVTLYAKVTAEGITFPSCDMELNGVPCTSCSMCDTQAIRYQADCSNVITDSILDQCNNVFSGAFDVYANSLSDCNADDEDDEDDEGSSVASSPSENSASSESSLPDDEQDPVSSLPSNGSTSSSETSLSDPKPKDEEGEKKEDAGSRFNQPTSDGGAGFNCHASFVIIAFAVIVTLCMICV